MKFKILLLTSFFIFSIQTPFFGQTCTSSGGDDSDFDLPDRYRFRCGTGMMKDRMNKVSKDYKLIEGCDNYWADGNYFRNKGKIYYSKSYGEFELVSRAINKSFRCENGSARDDNNFYFKGKSIANIDKSSFKSLGLVYCGDDKNVYYRNRFSESDELLKVANAESSTFKVVGEAESTYALDAKAVYYSGKALALADPESFELLKYGYAHDNNYVYYNGERVEGMNGANFKVLKDCFLGSDGVQLCNGNKVLRDSDAKSFKAIECGYYKDNNNVYINGAIIEGVDSESFQILSWGYTKDKNAVYCDLKLISGAKPASFQVLGRKYSKDKGVVFYLHHPVECDYKTFALDYSKDYLAKDKKGKISRGVRK